MFKLLTIIFCLVVSTGKPVPTKKPATAKPAIHYQLKADSTEVLNRHFDAVALKKIAAGAEFNYRTEKVPITWWDRFWNWVWHQWNRFWGWVGDLLEKLFRRAPLGAKSASVVKYFIIGVFAVLVIYVILKLLGLDLLRLFKKNQINGNLPYTELIENIHEINFDEAIENALSAKNYRLAVRLLYLRCLKQLSDNNLINWRTEKTNAAYLNELIDDEQRRQFSIVTRQFEYVWYGDFPVNGQTFQHIYSLFQEFKQHLS